ncbi:hypothetical protein SLEP1_g26516 [Rubroshorea leprosula]|uniref:Uncharacterized protein n=1 Tax=Rubroshorea leprosula TaxID=152421 RepID=A0AAV5JTD7_9ROSI|nr:hypothetical protein SLEP1_g26516 [Rubroshorea leprosula]
MKPSPRYGRHCCLPQKTQHERWEKEEKEEAAAKFDSEKLCIDDMLRKYYVLAETSSPCEHMDFHVLTYLTREENHARVVGFLPYKYPCNGKAMPTKQEARVQHQVSKVRARAACFCFCFPSSPDPLHPTSPPTTATHFPAGNPAKLGDFSLFSCLRTPVEPRKSQICVFPPSAVRRLQLVGLKFLGVFHREFSPMGPVDFLTSQARVLLAGILVLIVLSP